MKYDFDKLTERRGTESVKWEVAEGELPMWIADMDFEVLPEVKAAVLRCAERGIYGYSELPSEFFESVSDFWYKRHGYRFDTKDMVFCAGVVPALSSIVRKLTTPAENVLIQAPVYNMFYNSVLNNGRNIVSNDLIYEGGEYRMDFEDLEKKLADPQTSLMILCNPHNPVGKIWDKETLARVGELCHKYGVTVVSDEIHCSLTAPGKKYVPFASVNELCAQISVTCVAASKAFNLAGLQASTVIAKDPVLRHRVWRGINTDDVGEPNIFAADATVAALRYGEEWLDELNEYVCENRRFSTEYLKKHAPRLYVVPAEASYLLWVDISEYSHDSVSFARDMREKTGLYVSAGAVYGGGGERFLRINLATQKVRVEDGMSRLASYVKGLEK